MSDVIPNAREASWSCPYCRAVDKGAVMEGAKWVRCARCQFVFPFVPEADQHLKPALDRTDAGDETLTQKWGPVRTERYRVIRALASGAQGKLLLAYHRHLDQPCVIKLVASNDDDWAEVANQRLRMEAQAGIRVNHPNVARVYDCDCVEQAWYFVMEYIAGANLRRVLQQVHRLVWEQVAEIGRQVAAGLAAIHRNSLVHRDIKPSNVMLSVDGVAKIMDLGLVKVPQKSAALGVTCVGQALGTPLYMPPEQFDTADQIDARADIYSLGATLYHLLTGHVPFDGSDIEDILEKHRRAPIVWSDDVVKHAPRWLRETIEGCLAKRREHRFASAAALEEALHDHNGRQDRSMVGARPATAQGIVVTAFQNLSRQPSDDWIGDAIAESLSSRFMEYDGLHVADRNTFARVMRKNAPAASAGECDPGGAETIEAARLMGVTDVIMGSFHRQAEEIRIIAHSLRRDVSEVKFLASVQGPVGSLFALEDRLTDKIIEAMGPVLTQSRQRRGPCGGTKNLEAHENYIRGQRAFADGDYRGAISFARKAQALDPDYGEPLSLSGASFARLGEYERAVECHERQERIAREQSDPGELAVALGNLGAMYYYKGEYSVAFEFLERASVMSNDCSLTSNTAKLYGNLGMVQMRLGKCGQAERAFERAISICKELNDLVSMVWPYNGLGSVLLKQERFTEAREYHQRALRLAEEVGDRVMVGVSQMNIGRCACLMNDRSEAEIWFHSALGTLEQTHFWNGLTLVYEHMAEMYLLERRADDAVATIDKRIELAHRHGNRRMESEAWQQRARAFEQMNRTDEAIKALKKSVEISQQPNAYDSLHRYLEEVTSRTALG